MPKKAIRNDQRADYAAKQRERARERKSDAERRADIYFATGSIPIDHDEDAKHVADKYIGREGKPVSYVSHVASHVRTKESGGELFADLEKFVAGFVIYPSEHAKVAHILWIAHAHAMESWDSTPRLAFLSPEPASGKTRALEVSELLVPSPVEAVNVSPRVYSARLVRARRQRSSLTKSTRYSGQRRKRKMRTFAACSMRATGAVQLPVAVWCMARR
jgi:hypothetical protein